jgi:hypothetical protein
VLGCVVGVVWEGLDAAQFERGADAAALVEQVAMLPLDLIGVGELGHAAMASVRATAKLGARAARGVVPKAVREAAVAGAARLHKMAEPAVSFGVHKVVGRIDDGLHAQATAWAERNGWKACFAAQTPLRTPEGWKRIESFAVGDLVLSRDEHDPSGPLVAKGVEEVFVREGLVWHLHVGGQVIRTTAEHPFFVESRGWEACRDLTIGDRLLTESGEWAVVDDLLDTGEWQTVYNLRVADFHTYFVGCDEWGFSVWAHNATCAVADTPQAKANYEALFKKGVQGELEFVHQVKPHKVTDMADLHGQLQGQVARMNEIIQTEGLAGLKARIRAYDATVEAAGRAHVKTLPQPGNGMAWLHEPDMRTGGLATDVFRQGNKRTNSIIGGQANRIAQDILNLPDNVTQIIYKLTLR